MGAWGIGVWENDDAADFETELASKGSQVIEHALAQKTMGDYSDESLCAKALAAADLIAAAHGNNSKDFPTQAAQAAEWLQANPYRPTQRSTNRALKVVQTIMTNSELANLWQETKEAASWKRSLKNLETRLQKPPKEKKPSNKATRTVGTSKSKSVAGNPPASKPKPKRVAPAITPKAAKQLLIKKADGMLEESRKGPGLSVSIEVLDKLTQADIDQLSSLPNVQSLSLFGMKVKPTKQAAIARLLDHWKEIERIDASESKGLAPLLCKSLHSHPRLRALDLSHSDIADSDLQCLANHPTLASLDLSQTNVSDQVFDLVSKLPTFSSLSVHDCPNVSIPAAAKFAIANKATPCLRYSPHAKLLGISEPGAKRNEQCSRANKKLTQLMQAKWDIWFSIAHGDLYLGDLPDRDQLQTMAQTLLIDRLWLGINQTPIGKETSDLLQMAIPAWPNIQSLCIHDSKTLDDTTSSCLAQLSRLQVLEIANAKIGDKTASLISRLTGLRRLSLTGTSISAKGLSGIAKLPELRWLTIYPSQTLSLQALLKLRQELSPRCFVECLPSD